MKHIFNAVKNYDLYKNVLLNGEKGKKLIEKFDSIISEAKLAQENKRSYGYLPYITFRLIEMRDSLMTDCPPNKKTRLGIIGHVGYIILDNMLFTESPLCEKILDSINEYRHLD